MKNPVLVAIIAMMLIGCVPESDTSVNEIEGYWEMVYNTWTDENGVVTKNVMEKDNRMVKTFGKRNFMFMRMFPDSAGLQTWGAKGTYTFDEGVLTETIDYWEWDLGGYPIMYNIEFKGDSMIQKGPINTAELPSGWEDVKLYEVYLRVE